MKDMKNSSEHEIEIGEKNGNLLKKEDDDKRSDEKKNVTIWGNHIDYLLSSLGYIVGFGAFWRFPYVCMRNGGGAFLIPFFLSLFLFGIPLYLLETTVGQFTGQGPIGIWNLCPIFQGIGWGMVVMSALAAVYCAMILAWVFHFIINSFSYSLPWASCSNSWNTPACFERSRNSTLISQSLSYNVSYLTTSSLNSSFESIKNISYRSSAEEYWEESVLQLSSGIEDLGGIRWPLFGCLLATWVVVFLCLFKGIKWSGKVVYVTATMPYVFLTILLVKAVMLPGAWQGIVFYLKPDFEQLKKPKVWVEACLQICYVLGPTWGGLISMASHNKFNANVIRDTLIITLACTGTSFYCGFICFSILGYMSKNIGTKIQDVIVAGPGLVFNVYPEALSQMPWAPLWSIGFFVTIFFVGIDSMIGWIETVSDGLMDLFPSLKRKRSRLIGLICLLSFLLGIPFTTQGGMYLFQIWDWFVVMFGSVGIGFLEIISLSYIYGSSKIYDMIEVMTGKRPSLYWKISWCWIAPPLYLVLFLFICITFTIPSYGSYDYPTFALVFGCFLSTLPLIPIPIMAVVVVTRLEGTLLERLKFAIQPINNSSNEDVTENEQNPCNL